MIMDKKLMFDEDAAITVTRDSTNVIDLLQANQDIGNGENLWVVIVVTTAFTTGDAAVLQAALVTDDNAALDSATVLQDQVATIAAATLIAGYTIRMRIHPTTVMERYLGIIYTVTVGSFSAGKVTAGIVKDVQNWKAYPSNFVSA